MPQNVLNEQFKRDHKNHYIQSKDHEQRIVALEKYVEKHAPELQLMLKTVVEEGNESLYTRITADNVARDRRTDTLEKNYDMLFAIVHELQDAPMKEVYESKKESKRLIKNQIVSKFVETLIYVVLAMLAMSGLFDIFQNLVK